MKIEIDDLSRPAIHELLNEHLRRHARARSPPESVHALDIDELRRPEITFWSAWERRRAARLRRLAGAGPHSTAK